MTQRKDYYRTLGVPETASNDDIKRAYRKLAQKYHPDVNKAAGAEAQMKLINEAYDVLGDTDKRAHYDRFGSSQGQNPYGQQAGSYGQQGQGFTSFEQMMAEMMRQQQYQQQQYRQQRQRGPQQGPVRTYSFSRFFITLIVLNLLTRFIFGILFG